MIFRTTEQHNCMKREMLYCQMQSQTRHNFSHAVQITPSYSVRTFE